MNPVCTTAAALRGQPTGGLDVGAPAAATTRSAVLSVSASATASVPSVPAAADAGCRGAARPAWLAAAALVAAALLAGCAGAPVPAAQWVRLPAQPPTAVAPAAVPNTETWQLLGRITLPGHLDHSPLLLPAPDGARTRLVAHPQLRWAEPLRDAVPRLLQQDLQQALGAPLWTAPLPAGLQPTRQLRLELLALDAQPGGGVAVQARWVLSGPGLQPRQGELAFSQEAPAASRPVPAAAGDPADALVLAHRQALAVLAQRLADALR